MSALERNINTYKSFIQKNYLSPKNISSINIKSKIIQKKESTADIESEFENQIKKIFQQKKFFINNQYDHNGVKSFLKEKDECLKKMELDDSILYKNLKNLNVYKKNENKKNKSHKCLKSVDNKEKMETKNNNQKVADSFLSNKSIDCIEEILELLK